MDARQAAGRLARHIRAYNDPCHASAVTFNSDLFDRVADRYDERPPFFSTQGRKLVEFAGIAPGSRVLDVGAGRGAVTIAAVEAVGPNGWVDAVDVAQGMVDHLRLFELPNLRVHCADVAQLPLPDSAVDEVVSGFTMHILADLGVALREVHRVMRPGGTFCWSMPGTHPDAREWQAAYGDIFRRFEARLAKAPAEMSDENDMDAVIADSGFEVLEERNVPVSIPVGGANAYWDWTQSHGARWLTDALVDAGDQNAASELRHDVIRSLEGLHPTRGRDIMVAPLMVRMRNTERLHRASVWVRAAESS